MSYPDDIFASTSRILETPGDTITLEWPHAGLWLPVAMRLDGVGEGSTEAVFGHIDLIRDGIAYTMCYVYQEDRNTEPWAVTFRLANNFMEWQSTYTFGVLPRCPVRKGDQFVAVLENPEGRGYLTALHVTAIQLGALKRSLYKDAVGYITI